MIKKTIIKRTSAIFDIKTKSNQIKWKLMKKILKKSKTKKRTIKRKRIIIEFFSPLFFYKNNTNFTFQLNKKSSD
jgi:archaellum biogenesis ATPase FlaH